jgi:flagellin
MAVRELMRSEIAALNQGVRNTSVAVSLVQTADGALQVTDDLLIHMKELAEQAATGTYNSTQRLMIESEYQKMASEITRIAHGTEFSGLKLLDGSLSGTHNGSKLQQTGSLRIHFGTSNDSAKDYYDIEIKSSTASALGVGNTAGGAGANIRTQSAAQNAITAINNAIVSKDTIRATLGAMQYRLEKTMANLTVQAENLQAAESRISDVDVSLEMTTFVRSQILTQAAVAMLAQANALPKLAMTLINGA